tara:strand:- start:251 stop:556 length:306 start_codon:yes stop_codon:yes gene_type:complete
MPILIHFGKSDRKGKRYILRFVNPKMTIHFGSDVATTFTDGATEQKKNAYLARHRVNEDWSKINAGSASRFILWGESRNLETNLKDYIRRFKIKDNRKFKK